MQSILATYLARSELVSVVMAARVEKVSSAAHGDTAGWLAIVRQVALSRALDDLEEAVLVPERKVLYQFSARGHDVTQVLLGQLLTGKRDAVGGYYRSRPLMLTLGLSIDQALASSMMRSGGMSEGRDIGVVFNLPRREMARARCRCAAASALNIPRPPAGPRRCAIARKCSGIRAARAASRWPMGAMPRRPRTASGRRSTSHDPAIAAAVFH